MAENSEVEMEEQIKKAEGVNKAKTRHEYSPPGSTRRAEQLFAPTPVAREVPQPNQIDQQVEENRQRTEGRPPGMRMDVQYFPTEAERVIWVDRMLDRIEENPNSPFDEGSRSQLELTIQENILASRGISESEKQQKIQEAIEEIRSRWWLHSFNQLIINGKFADAIPHIKQMEVYLPMLLRRLPGLKEALMKYEADDCAIFKQPEIIKKRFRNQLGKDLQQELQEVHPDRHFLGQAAQRSAEKILTVLGVASSAGGLVIKDGAPSYGSEAWNNLSWEQQLANVDLNSSFEYYLPYDMTKLMYYGYRLSYDARKEKPEDLGNPKALPEMIRNLVFPKSLVNNFLDRGGITAENGRSRVEILSERLEGLQKGPNLEDADQIEWKVGTPEAVKNSGSWTEKVKYIDVEKTIDKLESFQEANKVGAPGFLWLLRLEALKELTGDLEKSLLLKPSIQSLFEVFKHLPRFARGDKEKIAELLSKNTYEFLTQYQEKYFGGQNFNKDEASVIFDSARQTGNMSKETEEKFYNLYLGGKKWRSFRGFTGAFDFGAGFLEMVKAFLKYAFSDVIGGKR